MEAEFERNKEPLRPARIVLYVFLSLTALVVGCPSDDEEPAATATDATDSTDATDATDATDGICDQGHQRAHRQGGR